MKLNYFLFHEYVKKCQSISFKERKENLDPNSIIIHFDFSENYEFIAQDEIQSAHWEHQSCTLFTAMVHYKEIKLKHESYVTVTDYLSHDKYAAVVILNEILNDLKLKHPNLTVENTTFRSDGTSQHFKQCYTLNWMTTLKDSVAWEFSATSHGKGDIDGIGGTCKRRVREKTQARLVFPMNSLEFSEIASEICPNINVIHCAGKKIQAAKEELDKTWASICSIPGTRKSHLFDKVDENIISLQTVSTDSYDHRIFNMKTGKFITESTNDKEENIALQSEQQAEFQQGQWVEVMYDDTKHTGQIIEILNQQYRVKCLYKSDSDKWWKLESDRNAVWYNESNIIG